MKSALGSIVVEEPHWVLLKKTVIDSTGGLDFHTQKALVEDQAPYSLPPVLDATVAFLAYHAKTGEQLLPFEPMSYTRCAELIESNEMFTAVGGFLDRGWSIRSNGLGNDYGHDGVIAYRRL